jgi:uncharacterized membrane protein HdeD (DUF308 family)
VLPLQLSRCWRLVALRGALTTLTALHVAHGGGDWRPVGAEGVVGIAASLMVLLVPNPPGTIGFAGMLALWAIATGALALVAAARFRAIIADGSLWGLAGAVSVVLGLLIALYPLAGPAAWVVMIALYALVAGGALLVFAVRLRRAARPRPE